MMGAQESIKRRHRAELGDARSGRRCQWDQQPWPCDVAILIERIETLEGALRTFVKWVDGLGDPDQVYVAEVLLKDAAAEARAALGETEPTKLVPCPSERHHKASPIYYTRCPRCGTYGEERPLVQRMLYDAQETEEG